MKAWWRAVRAEMLKLKHTLALWMVLIAPLAVAALIVIEMMLTSTSSKPPTRTPTEAWQALGGPMLGLWCMLMLPLFVTLQTALQAGLEHGNRQWKHLLALPVPRGVHYLGKLTIMAGMVVATYVLLLVLILLGGWVLVFTTPHAGLTGIEPSLLESAAAQGQPRRVRLWRVELPLALRSILAGVKIAAVINVGTATLGALIGAGGYGQPILAGIRLDDIGLILEGAVPAALLALLVQGVFELVERALTPRGLRLAARQ